MNRIVEGVWIEPEAPFLRNKARGGVRVEAGTFTGDEA